jgi:hypothetical protein
MKDEMTKLIDNWELDDLHKFVMAYALERYESGWHVIYETYDARELSDAVSEMHTSEATTQDLIDYLDDRQKLWNEMYEDITKA